LLFNPTPLVFSHYYVSSEFISHTIEVDDDNSNKEIEDKHVTNDDVKYEIKYPTLFVIYFWLETNFCGIYTIIGYF